METDIFDDEALSLARKSLVPGRGFFVPDEFEAEQEAAEAAEKLAGADTVVVADPDADGLACVALLRVAVDADAALLAAGPHDFEESLAHVAEFGEDGLSLFVCDLCPDEYDYVGAELEAAVEVAGDVRWFDHHQWDDDVAKRVRAQGVDLVVGDSDEECTADVALRSLDYEFADRYAELAAVTRDHDLWIKEDDRSEDIADYAYWEEPEEYVAVVTEHGVDLPEAVRDFLAERRVEKEALIEKAVDRAEFEAVGPWTVAVTYGRCSQNEVAETLRQDGADAAVVVKPAGSVSLRGSEGFERCHEVAGRVNGGGHPRAAGCKPDIYDDVLDYAHHWTTQGAVTKQALLREFEAVAAELDDEEEGVDTDR